MLFNQIKMEKKLESLFKWNVSNNFILHFWLDYFKYKYTFYPYLNISK